LHVHDVCTCIHTYKYTQHTEHKADKSKKADAKKGDEAKKASIRRSPSYSKFYIVIIIGH
jgi:hypothetical protein